MSAVPTLWPVSQPLFTTLLTEEIAASDEEAGPKAKAADTPFRHSDAGKCARYMSYSALGIERSNPPTHADLWVMYLGSLVHEKMQAVIERVYPGAKIEPASEVGNTSGHADGLFDAAWIAEWRRERILFELKTMGGFRYAKSVGLVNYKLGDPGGPAASSLAQGAINAFAHDCDTLVIGHLAMENVSKTRADAVGMRDLDRYTAEWHLSREQWEPIALDELARQQAILDGLENGVLGSRVALSDDMTPQVLKPDLKSPPWNCTYCSYLWRCQEDGPDPVPVPVEIRKAS